MEKEVRRVGLLDHKQLDPEYTKNELKVELDFLNELLESKNHPKVDRNRRQYSSWSKPAYISCIIQARLILLEIIPDFISERQQAFRESYILQRAETDSLFKARIDLELENSFFSLHKAQATREVYKNETYSFNSLPGRAEDNYDDGAGARSNNEAQQQHDSPVSVGAGAEAEDMDFCFSPF